MILKLLALKNIGRFEQCAWRGGSQFERLTLLYGENGRGKSTLCDIMRSFQTGTADYILGRKRLGATGECEALLLCEGNKRAQYKSGKWDSTLPGLAIFDTTFIHENVFAGDRVDHEHKKNLYRVIVGEQGVKLAADVDRLDGEIREAGKDEKAKLELLTAALPTNTDLKAFAKFSADGAIEAKIAAKEGELKTAETAQKKAGEIKAKGVLQTIALPAMPDDFDSLLQQKVATLSESAEKELRLHLAAHTNGATEGWLSQGLSFQKEEECPFCGQGVSGISLIASYRSFFDKAYEHFKKQLTVCGSVIATRFGERSVLTTQKLIGDSATLWEFWRHLGVGEDIALPDLGGFGDCVGELRRSAEILLTAKTASPLEPLEFSHDYLAAVDATIRLKTTVADYNTKVAEFNEEVNRFKARQEAVNIANLKTEQATLKLIELRFKPQTLAAIEKYKAAKEAKKTLEKTKIAAKTQLDTYSTAVLSTHEVRINELLKMFAAGFRIGGTEGSYAGGKVSSTYKLLINNVSVDLGDDRTAKSTPCFKNTLSGGDRSTLALALFISQFERDPNLKDKVVIFDDPFTSQDSRRTATQSLISSIAKRAKQVIVLSHDPYFLRALWDGHKGGATKSFQLTRFGEGTGVNEWDIEKETTGEYAKKHRTLWNYRYAPDGSISLVEVAQTIRPLLEEYLRLKLPQSFAENEWLGDFISKIRNAPMTDPVFAAQVILAEVEAINEYSKRYHHSAKPASDTAVVDEAELINYVERTLSVVGGF